jgi:hypothetical protein
MYSVRVWASTQAILMIVAVFLSPSSNIPGQFLASKSFLIHYSLILWAFDATKQVNVEVTLMICFRRCSFRISFGISSILIESFLYFIQTFQVNSGIISGSGYERFLPNPSHFIIQLSSMIYVVFSLYILSVSVLVTGGTDQLYRWGVLREDGGRAASETLF